MELPERCQGSSRGSGGQHGVSGAGRAQKTATHALKHSHLSAPRMASPPGQWSHLTAPNSQLSGICLVSTCYMPNPVSLNKMSPPTQTKEECLKPQSTRMGVDLGTVGDPRKEDQRLLEAKRGLGGLPARETSEPGLERGTKSQCSRCCQCPSLNPEHSHRFPKPCGLFPALGAWVQDGPEVARS